MRTSFFTSLSLGLFLLAGCGDGKDAAPEPVSIRFNAVDADGKTFACGATGLKLGSLTDALPGDLRLYVHDVALLKADGRAVPLELEQDGVWQHQGTGMLDFEDGTGACEHVVFGKSKTPDTRRELRGTPAEAGPYTGVRFVIGVPVEQNHVPLAGSPAPLGLTGMDHGPADGRQFLRATFYSPTTGAEDGDHHLLMLRSVCNNVTSGGGQPTSVEDCAKPNRPTIQLTREGGFDPAEHTVVLDVAALFRGHSTLGVSGAADLDDQGRVNCFGPLHGGDVGPMSGAARCGPLYSSLGLSYETGKPSGTQTVFRIE